MPKRKQSRLASSQEDKTAKGKKHITFYSNEAEWRYYNEDTYERDFRLNERLNNLLNGGLKY